MRFAQMNGGARYKKDVDRLNGGLNTAEPPALLEDHALTDCENVYWKDGALRTRPALCMTAENEDTAPVVATFETVDGEYQLIRTASQLLVYYKGTLILKEENIAHVAAAQHAFFAGGKGNTVLMFLAWEYEEHTGHEVWQITLDEERASVKQLRTFYEPIVFINGRGSTDRRTAGSMQTAEGFNLLSDRYRGYWTTDGESTWFCPPFKAGYGNFTVEYTHTDGVAYTFSVGLYGNLFTEYSEKQTIPDMGEVCLAVGSLNGECAICNYSTRTPVALPAAGFANNLLVRGTHPFQNTAAVFDMSFSAWFGGDRDSAGGGTRLFVGGQGHVVRYSDVDEPLYFPENNFMYVGDPSQRVTAFGKQNGALVIFKERELFGCEYAYKEVDESAFVNGEAVDLTAAAHFPLVQLHSAVGCDLPQTVRLCGNRLVWAHSDGAVYMLSALSAWSEKAVRCVSCAVEPSLRGKEVKAAALYHGNYLLLSEDEVYLFDYMSGGFAGFASYADERRAAFAVPWYRWRLPAAVHTLLGRDDGLLLVLPTQKGLCTARLEQGSCDRMLTKETPIRARVVTKPFSLGRAGERGAVYALRLLMAHTGGTAEVTFQGDGGDVSPVPYRLQTVCGADADIVLVSVPCRQARVRTLGVTVESDDPLVLTGLSMEYRIWKGV